MPPGEQLGGYVSVSFFLRGCQTYPVMRTNVCLPAGILMSDRGVMQTTRISWHDGNSEVDSNALRC